MMAKLRTDFDVNIQTRDEKWTLIHIAAMFNQLGVEKAIRKQPDVKKNAPDFNGRTGCHIAASGGRAEMLWRLAEDAEVDLGALDKWKRNPLMCAVVNNRSECLTVLHAKTDRIGMDAKDPYDRTPMEIAKDYGYSMCECLLERLEQVALKPE